MVIVIGSPIKLFRAMENAHYMAIAKAGDILMLKVQKPVEVLTKA
jgi:hypothetical protein